jgi:hypothetical protein
MSRSSRRHQKRKLKDEQQSTPEIIVNKNISFTDMIESVRFEIDKKVYCIGCGGPITPCERFLCQSCQFVTGIHE